MYKLFCATKVPVTNPKGFRKWSACKRRAPRKSLHPCGYVPREESRKTRVLGLPKMPKTRVVGHSSLLERHGSTNGHGTAPGNSMPEWRHCFRAFPPPLRYSPSRSYAPFLRGSPTEERQKKPWGFNSWRSVTENRECCILFKNWKAQPIECRKHISAISRSLYTF